MGCSGSKALALAEINQLIKQVCLENSQLEKERDKLKNQRSSDRADDDKNVLQDFKLMHAEFLKELQDLKTQMASVIETEEQNPEDSRTVKEGIRKIVAIQSDLEEKSSRIRDILFKREELKKEQENVEQLIIEMEHNIRELDSGLESQEESLKGHENFDQKILDYQSEKNRLISELQDAENTYKELKEELKDWEGDDESNCSDKNSFENLMTMSESDIRKELVQVDNELDQLSVKIKEMEIKEAELQQTDNYLATLSSKYKANSAVAEMKAQIAENLERINELRAEKKKVKMDIARLRNTVDMAEESEERSPFALANEERNKTSESIEMNVKDTLKRAKGATGYRDN